MGVVWQSGRGHPKFFGALRAHSFKRTPLLKFLDPPLLSHMCTCKAGFNIPILFRDVYAPIQVKAVCFTVTFSYRFIKQDCEQDYTANCIGNCCLLWSFSRQVSVQSAAHERSSHWVLRERAAYDVTNQKRTLTSNKDQSQ